MAQRLYLPIEQVFSDLGAIGAGYKLNTYETGTTTPKATYSNVALSSANTNPIIADSAGRLGDIFVDDLSTYKLVLTDADDVEIWSADPVDPKTFSLADFDPRPTSFWGTTAGTSTAYTLDSDPDISTYSSTQTFYFACHTDCGTSPTMAVDGLTALNLKKYDNDGSKVSLETGDMNSGQTYHARNDGADIVILNPEIPANISSTTTKKGYSYLPNQITISNGTDTNHDINFTAGNFQFDDGSGQAVASALTKQIDAVWAEGDAAGGLDTGSVAADTTYYMFAIWNPTTETADFLFSTSSSSPTLPSGYTKQKKIAALRTDGSANIRNGKYSFFKNGYEFELNSRINTLDTTTPSTTRVAVSFDCPPNSYLHLSSLINDNDTTTVDILFTSEGQTDATPSFLGQTDLTGPSEFPNAVELYRRTNASSEIYYRATDSSVNRFAIYNMGWKEYL